jgi:hypothetical protein
MPSILGGGEVIADALVLGTPRIVTIVGVVGVEVGVGVGIVVEFLVNTYPLILTSKITIAKIVIKIISLDFEGELVGGILGGCC